MTERAVVWLARLLVAAALGLGGLGSASAELLQIRDDRGVTVGFEATPQRIVSLLPSLTETVCALGACDRLVGVDRYSNFPAQVRKLTQLGGGIDPSIEAVVALRPDLVLMAGSGRGLQRLESLGLKVVALEPKDAADLRRVLQQLSSLLRSGNAQTLWLDIDAGVKSAARSLPGRAPPFRVYYEASRGPYAAGPKSFVGEVLQQLGVQNIVPSELGAFPLISPEFVVRADPDVILLNESSARDLAQRPGWAAMRALREGRICVFGAEQGDVLARPGPRMARAAELMARCILEKTRGLAP